ncbi:MAG: hypothetical protein GEV06_17440 [Luteitalea sp.]|nr:hypothetical protein [Luteitalea sp.]
MRLCFDLLRRVPLPTVAVLLAACTLLPSTAAAQASGIGVRGGVSADSLADQFYFGLHYETPELTERLTFRPNVEIGLGDDLTTAAFNFEFAYYLPIRNLPNFDVYVGGGPSVLNFNPDAEDVDSETEAGVNLLGGVLFDNGFFAELKIGAIDSPRLKFGVGYTWR